MDTKNLRSQCNDVMKALFLILLLQGDYYSTGWSPASETAKKEPKQEPGAPKYDKYIIKHILL